MPAQLKVYTDSGHTLEVAHTTDHSTTLNGALTTASTSATLTSTAGMPTSGMLDIIDGTNGNETIPYYGLSGSVVQLAKNPTVAHASGLTVNQWYYQLAVGDQTNGIPNDGTDAAPNGVGVNVATWYVYNAGDQIAQSPSFATVTGAPSTTQGFTDTLISTTSATAGFAATVTPANMAVAAVQQIWVVEEVPNGQSAAGNPQLCVLNLAYSTI